MSIKEWLESDGVHGTLMILAYIGGIVVATFIYMKIIKII